MDEERYLIIGLGNPGKAYEKTRHNIGFEVVGAFARKHQIRIESALVRAKGAVGLGMVKGKKVCLLLPLTYMNESGVAASKCSRFYQIPPSRIVVIGDDVDLPFGQLRAKAKGGTGGHNGLKSIEAHLATQDYARLRVGVGRGGQEGLAEYVLGQFSADESVALPQIIERAVSALEAWLSDGIEAATQEVNRGVS